MAIGECTHRHTHGQAAKNEIMEVNAADTSDRLDKGARPICYSLRFYITLYSIFKSHTHSLSCIYVIAMKGAEAVVVAPNYVGASNSSMAQPFQAIQQP